MVEEGDQCVPTFTVLPGVNKGHHQVVRAVAKPCVVQHYKQLRVQGIHLHLYAYHRVVLEETYHMST